MTFRCSIEGCDRERSTRGMCRRHYCSWWRIGNPIAPHGFTRAPDDVRFWRRVDKREPDECWPWQGAPNEDGYGQFRLAGVNMGAHRASWIIHNGPVPGDLWALHRCNVRICINPDHLYLGDNDANVRDRGGAGHHLQGERHPMVKLTDVQCAEIRMSDATGRALARQYCMSESQISNIRRGAQRAV